MTVSYVICSPWEFFLFWRGWFHLDQSLRDSKTRITENIMRSILSSHSYSWISIFRYMWTEESLIPWSSSWYYVTKRLLPCDTELYESGTQRENLSRTDDSTSWVVIFAWVQESRGKDNSLSPSHFRKMATLRDTMRLQYLVGVTLHETEMDWIHQGVVLIWWYLFKRSMISHGYWKLGGRGSKGCDFQMWSF